MMEKAKTEDNHYTGIDEGRILLDELEGLVDATHQRVYGNQRDNQCADRSHTAYVYQLSLGGILVDELLIDIHRKQGRSGVASEEMTAAASAAKLRPLTTVGVKLRIRKG